ncbi:uncharacterized protein LOC114526414 [Dendronephthya gigantea]|uniref:uncharacterized protein LOC114526414 n=1 Tax=Dendronephthya gigantea TaxID=151771 RepID=UPI001068D768|nr:uncharacterized protein LOC114526414 [Dendronephthya gigantea]
MGYCCQIAGKKKGCVPYNTCYHGRYGRLCGACMTGLTETLFTPSCRKPEKCKDYWFWPVAGVFVLGFTLYLLIQPDIFGIMYRYITWFRSAIPTDVEPESTSISGLEHIVFFYYQSVDILTVQSSKNFVWNNHFTQFTVGLFNFDPRLNRDGFACPFPGLNPVSKLLFRALGVVSVLFAIPFIFLLHKVASLFLPLRPPKIAVYLSAFLKSVLLGYNVLARKSLTLLHCVTVDGVNCLFVNCNIECYTWWQNLILTLVFIYFLPFVFVLFFGAKKLYGRHISVTHLLLAFIFPLPYLSYWFLNQRRLRERIMPDTDGRNAVSLILIGPYRVPDHVSAGAIYWESVLIGRMVVLVIVAVLVKDPFLSSLALLLLCIMNILLHIYVRPYKSVSDNRAEGISLFCLVLMALLNLPFMAYLSEGVLPAGPMSRVMEVFTWCQNFLVCFLPLICVALVIVAFLSQVVRLIFFFTKSILFACTSLGSCCCWLTTIWSQGKPDDLDTFIE